MSLPTTSGPSADRPTLGRARLPVPVPIPVPVHPVRPGPAPNPIRATGPTAIRGGVRLDSAGHHPSIDRPSLRHIGAERWLVVPAHLDPLVRRTGSFPMPRTVRRDLKRLHRSGLDLELVVAHQLPGARNAVAPSPEQVAAARGVAITEADADRLLPDPTAHPRSARTVGRLESLSKAYGRAVKRAGAGVAGTAAAGLAAAASAGAVVLDPIVYGLAPSPRAKPGRDTDLVVWFVVGRWEW